MAIEQVLSFNNIIIIVCTIPSVALSDNPGLCYHMGSEP